MPSWQGKTRGGVTGYKIFVFTLKFLGIGTAYFFLRFVIIYYLIFAPKAVKSAYYYFRKRLQFGFFKSGLRVYNNIYAFGQTLIDKVAILSGFGEKFTYNFENESFLRELAKNKSGGIILSGHFGNWEIAGQLLERLNARISILMYDEEHRRIKQYLSNVLIEKDFEVISIKEDGSHLFEIRDALSDGRLIAMHGDRFVEGNDVFSVSFLGKKAKFPTGPYHLAARYQVPVLFVYAVKESKYHYHFHADPPLYIPYPGDIEKRKKLVRDYVSKYVHFVEKVLKDYPNQWFNYYDFWSE